MKYYLITKTPTVNQEANDIPRIVAPGMFVGSLFPGVIFTNFAIQRGPRRHRWGEVDGNASSLSQKLSRRRADASWARRRPQIPMSLQGGAP